jgi:class 3 adenylate cyclase
LAPLLPADLFARARALPSLAELSSEEERAFADCLQRAISALDSLYHTLTNFVPRYLLDLSPTPGEPHGELLEGSFIFADVTGFTALTGELSKRGTEGREEMNRLMRALFAALLDPLLASGGDLLIFAGDAVLACFPARPGGQDARWATRTALRLVEAIVSFADFETPYGRFSLTMSVGVERGKAFAAVVGTRRRMELLVSGGPVQGATRAEGEAEPGQVVAGPGVSPFLRPEEFNLRGNVVEGIRGGELSDYEPVPPARRRRRISAIFSRRVPDLIEHLRQALTQVEALTPFIPPDLFAQIARGEDIRQHPPVAIQFVNILGIEDMALGSAGPERAAAVFQRYFVQAQEIVADREGIISQVDAYAKGFTLLNSFGAPTHHEGVPRLAASAALELARVLERVNQEFDLDPPLTQRTGLTYDRIFTGEIGYRHRREYVVAGPAVNLAARLMSKADPGQIVLDPAAWESVQADFLSDALPPIPLKGISEPVPRFDLQGLRRGRGLHLTDYPLAGRQEERAALEERLERAAAGQGGALALVGKAGIGKSRLVTALADAARHRGFAVLTGRCRPFAQTTPYLPWADVVGQWFELHDEMAPQARRQRLRERLAQFDLAASFPAFADLLGLPPIRLTSRLEQVQTSQKPGIFAAAKQQAGRERAVDGGGLAARLSERIAVAEARRTDGAAPSIWEVLRERAFIPQALYLLLERMALRQPTLVVIEDVQWMDPDSREVLDALVKAALAWPLFLLVTARSERDRLAGRPAPTPASFGRREPDPGGFRVARYRAGAGSGRLAACPRRGEPALYHVLLQGAAGRRRGGGGPRQRRGPLERPATLFAALLAGTFACPGGSTGPGNNRVPAARRGHWVYLSLLAPRPLVP